MIRKTILLFAVTLVLTSLNTLDAQNRGNTLSFQGVENAFTFTPGAFGSGLDAVTALGKTASIFYNPAGLSGLKSITFSTGFAMNNRDWWENQNYKPNRRIVTLPFYLEGLYIPDPANNGRLDSDVFFESLLDSSYIVANPEMGVEHFSEEAADWKQSESLQGLSHFGVAVPFVFQGKQLTLSAGYGSILNGISFDKNTTYLTPHPGFIDYDILEIVDGSDTLRMDWYSFERLQRYNLSQLSLGIGYELNQNIHLGLGMTQYMGSSDDLQYQDKVGYFDLIDQNEFIWSYDTSNTQYTGSADFSGTMLKAGVILDYDHFRLGLSYASGFDLTKDWSYDETFTYLQGDTLLTTTTQTVSGQEVMKLSGSYSIGIQMMPVERFTFLLSYEVHPYGSSEFSSDSTQALILGDRQDWIDQSIIQFGMRYRVIDPVHLSFLYRSVPQAFVPDGAALKEAGPESVSYRVGAEVDLSFLGAVDLGFQFQDLKYQDIYFSNTNYAREQGTSLTVSYIYSIK